MQKKEKLSRGWGEGNKESLTRRGVWRKKSGKKERMRTRWVSFALGNKTCINQDVLKEGFEEALAIICNDNCLPTPQMPRNPSEKSPSLLNAFGVKPVIVLPQTQPWLVEKYHRLLSLCLLSLTAILSSLGASLTQHTISVSLQHRELTRCVHYLHSSSGHNIDFSLINISFSLYLNI